MTGFAVGVLVALALACALALEEWLRRRRRAPPPPETRAERLAASVLVEECPDCGRLMLGRDIARHRVRDHGAEADVRSAFPERRDW